MAGRLEDYQKKMDELMDAELEEIERELAMHPEITALKASDSIKEKIDAKIAEAEYEKLVSKLPKEYQEDLRLGREVRKEQEAKRKRRMYSYWKRIAAAAAVVVLVAGIGVNSVGGPERVVEFFQMNIGGRELDKTVSTNDEDVLETKKSEEEEAYQRIKDELGFEPVKLLKILDGMTFKSFEMDADLQEAYFLYNYKERNISYIIQGLFYDSTWSSDVEDTKRIEYTYELNKTIVTIKEYQLPESGLIEYMARFNYQDVEYQLTAIMEWEEFELLLKNLHFL